MIQSIDYAAIAPPLILAITAGLVLLVDLLLPKSAGISRRTAVSVPALAGVIAALVAVVLLALGEDRSTFCVPEGLRVEGLASCSYVADNLSLVFAGVVLAAAVVVILLSMGERGVPQGEWYFLLLCALTGAVTLPASRDLITLVVALELLSLPVFALTALKRHDGKAGEAALKLFLVSVVSTAITLFGISLIYGVTGGVHLDWIAAALPTDRNVVVFAGGSPEAAAIAERILGVVDLGLVMVLAGFIFKIAVVPFHFWAPDVYQGAPIPVAALLSVISKAAGFAAVFLVLTKAFAGLAHLWAPLVAVLAALTMTVGNLLALRQRHAVRLLAWSSVAQSGYILAPLGVAGERELSTVVAASTAYILIYAAMNIGAFSIVTLVARARPRDHLDDYRGLYGTNPVAALAMAFFLVCLAGLPPGLAGLFAKVVVFREVVVGDLGWLAVVMAVNTVIGLYYYMAWAARLFAPAEPGVSRTRLVSAPVGVAVAVAVVITGVFSFAPQLALSVLN
ncbi:NADH-quinone oxidoreductase subunit N [Rhizohabitans arisaemae]|uniref:NADH-quinone oxidoreductase subunit N n=1 Tax=Rhizohabitans arisaemae TaxID=2720610 RepID=UPI0024B0CCDB|nr:NADH-quinone oxidoreductase subunit N [Rhizohabitans arisaemae]